MELKEQRKQSIKQINVFLICTFSVTWLAWTAIIIGNVYFDVLWYGEPLFWVPMLFGALGPAFGSYVIYRKYDERHGKISYFKFVFGEKITGAAWLIFGFFIIWRFFMVWLAFGIDEPVAILFMFLNLPLFVIGGGLEELGWRGYLQPKLERLATFFPSVVLVGIIWSVWHLPLWLIAGSPQSSVPFGLYLFMGIILSFSFTAFFKYTKSIFLTVLSHAWFNACIGLAVYIGSDGYLQLDLSWLVFSVFAVELVVSAIFAAAHSRSGSKKIQNPEIQV